jgi:p-methyltransferase
VSLDAILIADTGVDTFSQSTPFRVAVEGRMASVQVAANYVENSGRIVPPIRGDNSMSWASAPNYNGIFLLNYLKKRGYEVALINGFYEERESFRELLAEQPRALLVSTTFILNKKGFRKFTEEIRALAPETPVIVGGPLVYSSYLLLQRMGEPNYDTESPKKDFLFLDVDEEPSVDLYVVSQRGEEILCDALDRVRQGRPFDDLPNTATFDGQSYAFSRRVDELSGSLDLEVDWTSLPEAIFRSGSVTMQASNGCPYKCAFCNFVKDRRHTFVKPIDQLVTEMKAVASRGVRYVRFVDDNFRLGSDDLNEVAQRLVDEDLHLRWMSFFRASTLKNADLDLLHRAGCMEVRLGLESADANILRKMNKRSDPDLYAEAIRRLLAAGIDCAVSFIFGFPGETDETARQTVEFIKNVESPHEEGVLTWSLFPFIMAPLSPIYESTSREKFGLSGYMQDWKHDTMDSEQAKGHVLEAFLELEESDTIYSGDNIDMLLDLGPKGRQELVRCRHGLAKRAMRGQLEGKEYLESFRQVLNGRL